MTVTCPHCKKDHSIKIDVPEYVGENWRVRLFHWFYFQSAIVQVAVIASVSGILGSMLGRMRERWDG